MVDLKTNKYHVPFVKAVGEQSIATNNTTNRRVFSSSDSDSETEKITKKAKKSKSSHVSKASVAKSSSHSLKAKKVKSKKAQSDSSSSFESESDSSSSSASLLSDDSDNSSSSSDSQSSSESEKKVSVKPVKETTSSKKSSIEATVNTTASKHFSRVDVTKAKFVDSRLKDNSFTAKSGSTGSYGERAHRDLSIVRGRDFRQEKNKKKKGSYRGGHIDTNVHSIKFPSDDE